MQAWLRNNGLPDNEELAVFLACPTYRMMKLLDAVSFVFDPLGLDAPPKYETTRGANWIKQSIQANAAIVQATWGGEARGELDKVGTLIRDAIERITNAAVRVDLPEEKYELFAGGYERIPTFGLFPFYLLDERVRRWHVIPFATLTELGMVMSDELARSLVPNIIKPKDGSDARITMNEIKGIIDEVHANDRYHFLYFGGGHAACRIILSGLEAEDYRRFRVNLDDIHTVMGKRAKASEVSSLLKGKWASKDKYVLFSDLGDPIYSELRTRYRSKLTWVRIALDETIPVGIGFSLCTMAKILTTPDLLKDLAKIVQENIVQNAALVSALDKDGVRLNDNYVKYVELLASTQSTPASEVLETLRENVETDVKEAICTLLDDLREGAAIDSDNAPTIGLEFDQWKTSVQISTDIPNLRMILENLKAIATDRSRPMQVVKEIRTLFE